MTYRIHPSEHITHRIDKPVFLRLLGEHLKPEALLSDPEDLRIYDGDALSAYQMLPWIVALPETLEQAQAVLRLCHQHGVPVVARGAGTGISGGALPVDNGVLLSLAKFNRILKIDPLNRVARVQPGVRNLAVSQAAAQFGLYYAPDPSSQLACTIGGNIAENSGGPKAVKYGVVRDYVLNLELVLPTGEIIWTGSLVLLGYYAAEAIRRVEQGVEYVILTLLGGKEQLRRFAREIMPAFAGKHPRQLP